MKGPHLLISNIRGGKCTGSKILTEDNIQYVSIR